MPSSPGQPQGFIDANNLSAGYGNHEVLLGLSFSFSVQQTHVIVGPGGSGKTTLLRALGCDRREGDQFWTRGKLELKSKNPSCLAQLPPPEMRPLEEVLRGQGEKDREPQALLQDLWSVASECGSLLLPTMAQPVAELKSGVRRLAELSIALLGHGDYLVLDEPSAGVDRVAVDWIANVINAVRKQKTVLLATHNVKLARQVADTVLFLMDGEIVETAPVDDFFERPKNPRTEKLIYWGS